MIETARLPAEQDLPGLLVVDDEHTGIDWNVIFLLLGMIVIVGVPKRTGVFEYLAIRAAKRAKGVEAPASNIGGTSITSTSSERSATAAAKAAAASAPVSPRS